MRGRALQNQILAVNAALIVAAVLAASVAAQLDLAVVAESRQFLVLAAAILATVLVNAIVLRRRFAPLEALIETIERVDLATPGVRASPMSEDSEDVVRLRDAFNRMLDRLEHERAAGASAVLHAQEEERARLARDLHDELGALLTAAKLDAARLKSRLGVLTPEAAERLLHLNQTLNSGIALKRRIIEDLRPSSLSNLGLVAALEIQAREFSDRSGIPVDVILEPVPLQPSSELMVYRLVQEAFTNIAKYAQANRIEVKLWTQAGQVHVSVRDDGVGFDTGLPRTSAHGLLGMRYRVEAEGGVMTLQSAPGQGTEVYARLPQAQHQPAERTARAGLHTSAH